MRTLLSLTAAALVAGTAAFAQARDSDGEVISVIDGVYVIYKNDNFYYLTLERGGVVYRFDVQTTAETTGGVGSVQIAGDQYQVTQTGSGVVLTPATGGNAIVARLQDGSTARINPRGFALE